MIIKIGQEPIIETDLQSSASGSRLVRQSAGPAVDRWTANEGASNRIPGASTDARFGWKAAVQAAQSRGSFLRQAGLAQAFQEVGVVFWPLP
jgi:hypothetical protein